MKKLEVLEPLSVKTQMVKSATEAATMILRIDDVIAGGKMKTPPMPSGRSKRNGWNAPTILDLDLDAALSQIMRGN